MAKSSAAAEKVRKRSRIPGERNELSAAYAQLIKVLLWERDRFLQSAERLARDGRSSKATRVLRAQAKYIRELSVR